MRACGALGCAPAHTHVGEGPCAPQGAAGSEALVGAGQWLWDPGEGRSARALRPGPRGTCGPRSPSSPLPAPQCPTCLLPSCPCVLTAPPPIPSILPSSPTPPRAAVCPSVCGLVGRRAEIRGWISFPGDPGPRGPESPLRSMFGEGVSGEGVSKGGELLSRGIQLRHSAQTRPQVEAFYPGGGFFVEGPEWGVSNSGSRPLGEGGQDSRGGPM